MKKLRWAVDGGFWDLDMSTATTIDGVAREVPGDPLPLGLSRGVKLSRSQQLHFMHKFMSLPLVPCISPDHGFSLQRALSLSSSHNWLASLVGQLHLQKLISSIRSTASKHTTVSSFIKNIMTNFCDKSLYAVGICSELLIGPDDSILFSSEAYGDKKGRRNKFLLHRKLPRHNLTFEATSPGLFIDCDGTYWDVPLSMAFDLASIASCSGYGYRFCIHHNHGEPDKYNDEYTSKVPPNLLNGSCAKAAFTYKKDVDIWREKGSKLRRVQPFDMFQSDPHVSLSATIGTVVSASLKDKSAKLPTAEDQQPFNSLNLLAQWNGSLLHADLFSSLSFSAQYGNFQRPLFDFSRLNARLEFPSGCKVIAGAASLANSFYNSEQPDMEAVCAICPRATLSVQQQLIGPVSFHVDSRVSVGLKRNNLFAQVDDTVFAFEYALKVLGSAKAVAWYSPKHQEAMVELRFFES